MSTLATPENIARLNHLNEIRKDMDVLTPHGGNSIHAQGNKYTVSFYKQKLRDIKQLGKDTPVTILNTNPFPLKINGGALFPEEVPACPVGTPYVTHVLDVPKWQSKDNGADANGMMQLEPIPYVPLTLAAEYIREFIQADYARGGVVCYAGNADPSTFKPGHIVDVPELNIEDGELFVDTRKRSFHEVLSLAKAKRNNNILRSLQIANSWYENDHQRHFVNDTHRELARLAFKEELIPELPRWVMQAHQQTGPKVAPCPSCGVTPKEGAILCTACGDIFNVVEAYRRGRIAYGAVEMDRLTAEEWPIVNKIKADRDKARGKANPQ